MREAFTQAVLHLCLQYLSLSRGNVVLSSEIYSCLLYTSNNKMKMKQKVCIVSILLLGTVCAKANNYKVSSPDGRLAVKARKSAEIYHSHKQRQNVTYQQSYQYRE